MPQAPALVPFAATCFFAPARMQRGSSTAAAVTERKASFDASRLCADVVEQMRLMEVSHALTTIRELVHSTP